MKTNLSNAILTTVLIAATTTQVMGGVFTVSTNWTGSQAIPDNDGDGVAYSFNVVTPSPATITSVTVSLSLIGGWNGDLYAYLSHGSGLSVLLNRMGRSTNSPGGYGSSGMTVTLSDANSTDIHLFSGSPVIGNFAPDGRNVNPLTVLDTSPRTAILGNFTGLDPNGTWTLFFADLGPAAITTLQSWTVNINGVPEPNSTALAGLAISLSVISRAMRRQRRD